MRTKLAITTLVAIVMSFFAGCSTPGSLSQPRPGNPVNDRVAVVYSDNYQINLLGLEKLHPFDINKYTKICRQLVKDGLLTADNIEVPDRISRDDLLIVHTPEYLDTLTDRQKLIRYLEAPALSVLPRRTLKKGVVEPFRYATAGTLLAARRALEHGIAVNIGGGYHHAKPDTGEGFCVFADVPIAIRKLQGEDKIKRALVIDLDVHQGNGTIACLRDDPTTFTFSVHQGSIYPIPKEPGGDLDIEVNSGDGDDVYERILAQHLDDLFEKSNPDIVFYVAGCDTLAGDPLASLAMTHEGILKRDMTVIDACVDRKVPVVYLMAGGYSKDAWEAQYKSLAALLKKHAPPKR